MMKSYLRYAPSHSFGAICSPSSNAIFDFSGNLILTAAVEEVCVWNARQASKVSSLKPEQSNYPFTLPGEVTFIERSSDKCTVAVGYSNGQIRLFNLITNALIGTFKGHRTGVSCLCYEVDNNSTILASGGKDSDIYLWDIIAMSGLCKLRGHKDVVTSVRFFSKGQQRMLVSASKDTLIKVWDLVTEYCVQTIVGHRSEVWCMAIRSIGDSFLLLTGSSDDLIRGYTTSAIAANESEGVVELPLTEGAIVLDYIGSVTRQFGMDKCTNISFNESGDVIVVQSSGKNVELFSVRDDTRAKKKMKRRLKRLREKMASAEAKETSTDGVHSVWQDEEGDKDRVDEAVVDKERVLLGDVLLKHETIRCGHRVRSSVFRCDRYCNTPRN
jgi:U3 small nucleolar RNA-associated protein 12